MKVGSISLAILLLNMFCMEAKRSILDNSTPEGFGLRYLSSILKVEILKRDYPQIPDKIRLVMKGSELRKQLYPGNFWLNWTLQPLENPSSVLRIEPQTATLVCDCYYTNFYEKREYLISARSLKGELFQKKITIEIASPLVYLDSGDNSGISGICPSLQDFEKELYLFFGNSNSLFFRRWDGKNGWNIQGNIWQELSVPPYSGNFLYPCPRLLKWKDNLYAVIFETISSQNWIKIYLYNKLYNVWGLEAQANVNISFWSVENVFASKDFIFVANSDNTQTRFFVFNGQSIQEIQSINAGTMWLSSPSIVEIGDKVLTSTPTGTDIYELDKSNLTWNFFSSWNGYYNTLRTNFQMLNFKEELYIGWLEHRPPPNYTQSDVRLVKRVSNGFNWLDGGNSDSKINFLQEFIYQVRFAFLEDKIYSLYGNLFSSVLRMKVYRNQNWVPISENLTRGFVQPWLGVDGSFIAMD
ncbi:MAG: hypothetical protein N3A69_14780, partial [Leptospiraceae bacterium]|nr:hypothetical protein [Leptospiraceae bacterium]